MGVGGRGVGVGVGEGGGANVTVSGGKSCATSGVGDGVGVGLGTKDPHARAGKANAKSISSQYSQQRDCLALTVATVIFPQLSSSQIGGGADKSLPTSFRHPLH